MMIIQVPGLDPESARRSNNSGAIIPRVGLRYVDIFTAIVTQECGRLIKSL